MAQPSSHHTPTRADPSEDLSAISPSQTELGASVLLPTPSSLQSSPRPSVAASSMAVSLEDIPAPAFKDRQPMKVEDLGDHDVIQWESHNPFLNPMTRDHCGFSMPLQYDAGTAAAYNYDQSAYNDNHNIAYQCAIPPSCPRSVTNTFDMIALPRTGMTAQSFPPPLYQMGPQQPYEGIDLSRSPNNNLIQLDNEYEDYPRTVHEDISAYSTPYNSEISRSCTPLDGSPFPPRDDAMFDKDRPYAQLIFEALKQAPNHTMILRDIYDWFKKNTDKALDKDTKGWQNSIRHNLSMNGAFEKVDHPCDDMKKGFMWRLTDDALANGVKSTTRYRSKQPNKRGHRTGLYPQRQRAGAIGGRSAKKQLRHKARMPDPYRSEPYHSSRSMPTPATFDSTFKSDMSMCVGSPAYCSHPGSDIDNMEYRPDIYGNAADLRMAPPVFHGIPHGPMSSSPLASYSDGYIQLPSDPAVPLFTSSPADTPSPSASEPRTPDSQTPGWDDGISDPMSDMSNYPFVGFPGDFGLSDITHTHFARESLGNGN